MMWTISLILITLGFGGALEKTSYLKSIINTSIGETNALFVAMLPYSSGVRQCRIAAASRASYQTALPK
ncbi:MAG: Na+/H+ antiporter NhaC [Candidatus Endobugula sp.]|jgi:Na+/H+ antiporter NhaC